MGLIAVEGTTCSGKTTFANLLVARLNEQGIPSNYRKMLPSQTPNGQSILKTEGLTFYQRDKLFLQDFYASLEEAEMLMNEGQCVIVDRYLPSFLSFCSWARQIGDYQQLCSEIDYDRIITPEKMVLLSANPAIKQERAKKKDLSSFDNKSLNDSILENLMHDFAMEYGAFNIDTSSLTPKTTVDCFLAEYSPTGLYLPSLNLKIASK